MPECFIVTIADLSGTFEVDLEIPATMPFSDFKSKLLEILKIMGSREFLGWRDYALQYKNRVFRPDETLALAGAFDGSHLFVAKI